MKEKYYSYLEKYLHYNNFEIQKDGQLRCPNFKFHNNNDNNFSAHLYNNTRSGKPIVKCFSCGFMGDIYDIAGILNNCSNFKDQYKVINNLFGFEKFETEKNYVRSDPKKNDKSYLKPAKIYPISKFEITNIYNRENLQKLRNWVKSEIIKNGEITGHWFYTDKNGKYIAMDIRFEFENKKIISTIWYDGKFLRLSGKINIIYNLYNAIKNNNSIIIHEGAKCAALGIKNLKRFTNVGYNRGTHNAGKPDWSLIKDKKIYILPDNDNPGMKAAEEIKKKLPDAIILKDIYKYFKIDHIKSADIEELLENADVVELKNYINLYQFI